MKYIAKNSRCTGLVVNFPLSVRFFVCLFSSVLLYDLDVVLFLFLNVFLRKKFCILPTSYFCVFVRYLCCFRLFWMLSSVCLVSFCFILLCFLMGLWNLVSLVSFCFVLLGFFNGFFFSGVDVLCVWFAWLLIFL